MAVQGRLDQKNFPFWLSMGDLVARDNETIIQNAARATALAPYTLMGRVRVAAPTTGTADAANVAGTGTLTAVALIAGTLPRVGTWVVECIAAVANGGTFKVTDPSGNIVRNNLVMAAGAGAATVFYLPEIGLKFTLTDGATDFSVGEKFTIAITAVNKWTPFDPAAVNGAQIPAGIFVGDSIAAASIVAGDVTGQPIVIAGNGVRFDDSLLVLENGAAFTTVLRGGDTVADALYRMGFFPAGGYDISLLENT